MNQCFICTKPIEKQYMIFEARNGNRKYIGRQCIQDGDKKILAAIKKAREKCEREKLSSVQVPELVATCSVCDVQFQKMMVYNGDLCFDCHEAKYPNCLLIGTDKFECSYKDHEENMSNKD